MVKIEEGVAEPVETDEEAAPEAPKKKKTPTIVPHPVPGWLYPLLGPGKNFDEILELLHDLRAHLTATVKRGEEPHFPDIEILPNLKPNAAVVRKRKAKVAKSTETTTKATKATKASKASKVVKLAQSTGGVSRVDAKGAVKKSGT
jgi:hypothetical protein